MEVLHITKENFEAEVLNSDKPVLLDFWASWCGPCRMLAPILDDIAGEREDIKVCKVNVDEEPDLARQFGVMSIPTVVFLKNGREVDRKVGLMPEAALEAALKSGKVKRAHAYKSHILNKKTTKRKRNLRKTAIADVTNVAQVKRLIPYK